MSTPSISNEKWEQGLESTSSLFESSRPDACIVTANGEVLPLELTVCHELNFQKARDYIAAPQNKPTRFVCMVCVMPRCLLSRIILHKLIMSRNTVHMYSIHIYFLHPASCSYPDVLFASHSQPLSLKSYAVQC